MPELKELLALLRDPGPLIAWGGYPALAAIVFLETGALVFFLPGDSLLVVAGFFAARGELSLLALNALLAPLAILGDAVSYQIGKHMGHRLRERPDGRLLKREHIQAAHNFYERHGGKAIVLARFVPVVRTFVPVVAGAAAMPYSRFFSFNVLGGIGWVAVTTCSGYFLGQRFPALLAHTDVVIVTVVALSLLPVAIEWWRARQPSSHP